LPQDQWVFVALTYDIRTGQMILYRNGTPRNTGTAPVGDRNVTVSNIYIGSFEQKGFRMDRQYRRCHGYMRMYFQLNRSQRCITRTGNNNIMANQETIDGEVWQTHVTPFSSTETGTTTLSNNTTIGSSKQPVNFKFNLTPKNPTAFNDRKPCCSYDLAGTATTVQQHGIRTDPNNDIISPDGRRASMQTKITR